METCTRNDDFGHTATLSGAKRGYLPSLEGIRAYAFLMVFMVHYSGDLGEYSAGKPFWMTLWYAVTQVSWIAVPIFFVLSGFLITGVIVDAQAKEGFIRVFYWRRVIRVLPLYYMVLAIMAAVLLCAGLEFQRKHLLFLVYLQNFERDWRLMYRYGRYFQLGHLWSLAVEEQFYCFWPLVIWMLRKRERLLQFCFAAIGVCCLFRVMWPWMHLSMDNACQSTLTRGDALMLGAALALYRRGPKKSLAGLVRPSKWVVCCGFGFLITRVLQVGQCLPNDYFGLTVLVPLINVMSAGIVVLAIEPGNLVNRWCCARWAVSMGSLSYGLYLFHYPFLPVFEKVVIPALKTFTGSTAARLLTTAIAFALTYALAKLSYRFVEVPLLRYKDRVQYVDRLRVPERRAYVPAAAWRRWSLRGAFGEGESGRGFSPQGQ